MKFVKISDRMIQYAEGPEGGIAVEIRPVTITVHVRGGVAYPPNRLPKHVRLNIIDHDNEGR